MSEALNTGKELLKKAREDDITGLAAELAYKSLLALFPFLIFLAALGGFVSSAVGIENPSDRIMSSLEDSLPSDAAGVLRGQLREVLDHRSLSLLSLGLAVSLWSASSAMGTIMKALNRVYGARETRPFWRRALISVALTAAAGVFFTTAFAALIIGQIYAKDIGRYLGIGGLALHAANWVRVPAVGVLLGLATALLYWAAPDTDVPLRWVSLGALLFILSWIVFTLGFGFYVAHFGAYNETYGTLGGVIVLMVWMYLSSLLLLAGAELNALFMERNTGCCTGPVPVRGGPGVQKPRPS